MKKNRKRSAALLLAVIFGAGTVMAACGQKGPLYLPDKEKQEQKEKVDNQSMNGFDQANA